MADEKLTSIAEKSDVLKKHIEKAKNGSEEYKTAVDAYEELLKAVGYDEIIVNAFIFTLEKHEGHHYEWKNRKKLPYAYHLAKCAIITAKLKNAEKHHIILALFHDIIEDKRATENEVQEELNKPCYSSILANSSNEQIIEALILLDKNNSSSNKQYYTLLAENKDALLVKTADILANLNECLTRAKEMMQNEQRFWIYEYLEELPKHFAKNEKIIQKLEELRKKIPAERKQEFEKYLEAKQ